MHNQSGWHICFKCNIVFFGGGAGQGVCIAGGAHDAHVFNQPPVNYAIGINEPVSKTKGKKLSVGTQKTESGWRRCRKCECLFHAAHGSRGICAADNGGHEGDHSIEYQIALRSRVNAQHAEVRMRKCKKCMSMFWDSNWTAGVKKLHHAGRCPGKHEPDFPSGTIKSHDGSESSDYAIAQQSDTAEQG